jgi:hypothetical protein
VAPGSGPHLTFDDPGGTRAMRLGPRPQISSGLRGILPQWGPSDREGVGPPFPQAAFPGARQLPAPYYLDRR